MKKISILIPCFNEKDNVQPICIALCDMLESKIPDYDYEIIFIDNKSVDGTRDILRKLCRDNANVKAIFNSKNFGQFNSPYYGLCQTTGDCVVMLSADFQDPIELIPVMVKEWENGHDVICPIKTSSKENKFIYFLRGLYYKTIKAMSNTQQIEQFTGFGLYDRRFIEILKDLKDPTPFLRGIVAEFASNHIEIPYEQQKRRSGKSHNNFFTLFDAAMLSFTSYTKGGLRIATFSGFVIALASFLIAIFYLVYKLIYWDTFATGNAPILIGVFFLGGLQMFFIGLLGEYIMSMNTRVINRPLVIEEERINF